MPKKPKKGQTQNQFMDTCMHEITQNEKKRTQDQRVAICLSYWSKNEDNSILNRLDLFTEQEDKECPEGQKY